MGMYTELIFGAKLKQDTPEEIIDVLKYMVDDEVEIKDKYKDLSFTKRFIFWSSSYYFGVNKSNKKIWFDDISHSWRISTRSNLKNYGNEIEEFLEWIKPYIESGSGARDMYAVVLYEEASEPTIYYLDED